MRTLKRALVKWIDRRLDDRQAWLDYRAHALETWLAEQRAHLDRRSEAIARMDNERLRRAKKSAEERYLRETALNRREAELDRREAELNRREAELARRAQQA